MPLPTRYVPPEQTIVVKGLEQPEVLVVKSFVAMFTNPLGVAVHADHADKDCERSLLYCNYRTPLQATNALDGVVQFVLQTFAKISEHHQVPGGVLFARLSVDLKSNLVLDKPRFSVCLNNTPPWTAARLYQYVSQVMCRPLNGIAVYDTKRESPGVRFVRFDTFEEAKRLLDLSDAGKLRAEGFVMHAAAARNTAFVQSVAQAMDAEQCAKWTFGRVHAFTVALPKIKWPPMKGNIEQVLHAVPCEFALDDSERTLYRVRGQVQADVETRDTIARGKPAAVVGAHAAGCDTAKTRGALVALASGPEGAKTGDAPVAARADVACAKVKALTTRGTPGARGAEAPASKCKAAKTRGTRGVATAKAPPCPAALPSQPAKSAIEASLDGRERSVPSLCQTPGFTQRPWLWPEKPVPNSTKDDLRRFDFSSSSTLPTLSFLCQKSRSRYAFANVTCEATADECGSTAGPPVSPCLSASTDIKPEDSRSMCSQAPTHSNPMRSWGVQQVAEFFETVGFQADAVRDGSVDGETLLQKFGEGDCDFFTQPAPEGLGLTKLQYKGRLHTELLRWNNAHGQAREACP